MHKLLLWSPRFLGVLIALSVGAYAPVPAAGLLAVVALAWRWEWVGGVAFTGVALFHAADAITHPDAVLAISVPSIVAGLLFLVSWHELKLAPQLAASTRGSDVQIVPARAARADLERIRVLRASLGHRGDGDGIARGHVAQHEYTGIT